MGRETHIKQKHSPSKSLCPASVAWSFIGHISLYAELCPSESNQRLSLQSWTQAQNHDELVPGPQILKWSVRHMLPPLYLFSVFLSSSDTAISEALVEYIIGMSNLMSNSYLRSWVSAFAWHARWHHPLSWIRVLIFPFVCVVFGFDIRLMLAS